MNNHSLIVFLLIISLFSVCFESRATDLSGSITADTLKKADSPFTVIGNISLSSSRTLVIEAGVIVKFNSGLNFLINGTLKAVGTSSDSIRFTSSQGTPNAGDWNGLSFPIGSNGTLQYVIVEYTASGVILTTSAPGISNSRFRSNNNGVDCFSSATPLIESSDFTGNSNTAVRCNQSSPTIKNNRIFDNVAVSSSILCENSSPRISGNQIYNNSNSGIDCSIGAKPEIWQNTLSGNDFGITISDSAAPVVNGNIVVNHSNIGIAINSPQANPTIKYNDVWSNTVADYFGASSVIGNLTTTNANDDPADINFNINSNPQFVNAGAGNYQLLASSQCLDAGDPTNPAGVVILGSTADIGALEFNGAVPVELVSFTFADGILRWTTTSETDNFGFEIQRSISRDGPFIKAGFVKGAGTSLVPHTYSFSDSVRSGAHYYRLKQIDLDGAFLFSEVIFASFQLPEQLSLSTNYPNPFNPSTTIRFTIPETGLNAKNNVQLDIFNTSGQLIFILLDEQKPPGYYQLQWHGVDNSGRPVTSGIYFYRLRSGSLNLTRSMMLIK